MDTARHLDPAFREVPTVGGVRQRGSLAAFVASRDVKTDAGVVTHYLGTRPHEFARRHWVKAADAEKFDTWDDAAIAAAGAERYTPQPIKIERIYRNQEKGVSL